MCTTTKHVTRRNSQSPRNPKGDGKPARAGGRCLVTMPSRRVRARKFRGRVEPSGACDRGGANWYPSQYPAPAGLKASDGWGDCHDGGGSRPGSARRPVWCTARAGSGPAAGPDTVEAGWRGRLGRVRPGRGPGHSGGEVERPTGPSSARPRARAQWRRGGEADWAEFGPAAGLGTVEARRSSRRASVQQRHPLTSEAMRLRPVE